MELFCVICKLADGARMQPAETIYDGMALCGVHFGEIADYQDLDAVKRDAVINSRRATQVWARD